MKKFLIILVVLALILVAVVAFRQAGEKPDPKPGVSADQPTGQPTEEPDVTPGTEPTDGPASEPGTEPPASEPVEEPTDEPGGESEPPVVRFAVLSGPTGVGAAKLLSDADKGAALNAYDYLIATENSELVAALTKGEVDIATVASNVALNLYNKTNGGVKIIALGTQGVLHILEGSGGTDIQSVEDLFGQTIYSPGQGANPEYILRYLLMQYGIDPDMDVNIVFAEAGEIQAKLLSGEIKYAMLPVPAATAAIIKGGGQVRAAVDVTEAWNEMSNGSSLIMTAVVARTEFIEQNPEAVNNFLKEYEASIDFVNNNVDEAAEMIAGYGITPNAAIAKQAIPQCHLVYIAGKDMISAISDYFMELYNVSPDSVGGSLPDSAIYYVP